MKIAVVCPGSLNFGLDSPERGESRWAQNLARLLGHTGFKVYAIGGDPASWGNTTPVPNVTLVPERQQHDHGVYDIYIDSAWWKNKLVPQARNYFHVHWSLEEHIRPKLPNNHFIIYPYYDSTPNFIHEVNQNIDRTFFLPTPFCKKFKEPQFSNTDLLWPQRPEDVYNRPGETHENAVNTMFWAVDFVTKNARSEGGDPKLHVLFSGHFKKQNVAVGGPGQVLHKLLPYHEILNIISKVKLNLSVNLPSCTIDTLAAGGASLVWEHGCWDNFIRVAKKHNLLIPQNPTAETIWGVCDRLIAEEQLFRDYVVDLQHIFRHHTEAESIRLFNEIVSKL